MQAFGYTAETMQFMLLPLVVELRDPHRARWATTARLAVMSDKPRMLYDYFKQLFAQVTNPAIDSIREEVVMALECYIGPEGNLLEATEAHAQRLRLAASHPLQRRTRGDQARNRPQRGWRSRTIDITFPRDSAKAGLLAAFDRICAESTASNRRRRRTDRA